jgi:hypothetical protein
MQHSWCRICPCFVWTHRGLSQQLLQSTCPFCCSHVRLVADMVCMNLQKHLEAMPEPKRGKPRSKSKDGKDQGTPAGGEGTPTVAADAAASPNLEELRPNRPSAKKHNDDEDKVESPAKKVLLVATAVPLLGLPRFGPAYA